MQKYIYILGWTSMIMCTDRGSIVKAMFVLKENNELHPYYGSVQFFFRICITLRHDGQQEEIQECILSYGTVSAKMSEFYNIIIL